MSGKAHPSIGLVVSAAFGPGGQLWRVIAGKERVYVDHSEDLGRSFSKPVPINPEPWSIRVTSEDRPGIAIDEKGRIVVLFAAASKSSPWTVFFSSSMDGGRHFSHPLAVVPDAAGKTYQAKPGAAGGTFHVFWHQGEALPHEGTPLYWAALKEFKAPLNGRIIAGHQCECCRIALAFDSLNRPVLLTRFVFPGTLRDHGLIFPASKGTIVTRRVSYDEWQLEACPEHGPALAIDEMNQIHMVWFTLGRKRRGLFYARSNDQGLSVTEPVSVGDPGKLAGHPSIAALGKRIVLVWQEFDGRQTIVKSMQSNDLGLHWSPPWKLASTAGAADYPFLLVNGEDFYLSWNTEGGYHLIPIP